MFQYDVEVWNGLILSSGFNRSGAMIKQFLIKVDTMRRVKHFRAELDSHMYASLPENYFQPLRHTFTHGDIN